MSQSFLRVGAYLKRVLIQDLGLINNLLYAD